ncbi:hypothetical protein BKA70DRAFT_1118870 [Coprinopsis sp. MPI-PUGE-AT-0042]|nr:hypothetical protein BKA70DRAFT_1118870 [Coprinopsis sp. MPI-PUGE-AT-0042]
MPQVSEAQQSEKHTNLRLREEIANGRGLRVAYAEEEEIEAHLRVLSDTSKHELIMQWQERMSPHQLIRSPCSVCSKLAFAKDLCQVHGGKINLELLRNDDLDPKLLPKDYNLRAYKNAILCARGLVDTDNLGFMRICKPCLRDLRNKQMPRFSLANWLYFARDALPDGIREGMTQASQFKKALICRAREFGLKKDEETHRKPKRGDYYNTKKGMKGNLLVAPLDVLQVNSHLPPSQDTIRDTLCVLFLGAADKVTPSTLKSCYPILVRKSRVKCLIGFLLENNPHYCQVAGFKGMSEENLNALFEGRNDQGLPSMIGISYLEPDQALDNVTSDYVPPSLFHNADEHDTLLMENVVFTMSDRTPQAFRSMKMAAISHCLNKGAYLRVDRATTPIPDFDNPYLLSWLFPHLDPWGIGSFHHPKRKRPISMQEQLSHLLQVEDRAFETDPKFAVVFYNIIRKQSVASELRFSAPLSKYQGIVNDLLSIDKIQLLQLSQKFQKDPLYFPQSQSEVEIMKTMKAVGLAATKVPGSCKIPGPGLLRSRIEQRPERPESRGTRAQRSCAGPTRHNESLCRCNQVERILTELRGRRV